MKLAAVFNKVRGTSAESANRSDAARRIVLREKQQSNRRAARADSSLTLRTLLGAVAGFFLIVIPVSNSCRAAEPLPAQRQQEILREGLDAFDQAVSIARQNPKQASELYRKAAADFAALTESGLHNAALEYNRGNVAFRLNELGPAVLHYRRALRLAPGNAGIAANLEYVRNRVQPTITAGEQNRLLRNLLFWHYGASLNLRFWLTAFFSVAGWGLLLAWLRWRTLPVRGAAALLIFVSLVFAGSAGWQLYDEQTAPPAVIVKGEHTLRLGRGEGYDAALKQPLGPGVELRIINERGDWFEVRLANGQTGWLPAAAIERV